MGKILLQGGTLISAEETVQKDLLIDGETIAAVENRIRDPEAVRIDISGKLLMPGGVDPHTHFDLPMFDTVSSDDHYTGHKAAAFGGTTTVMDFVPHEGGDLSQCVSRWREKAAGKTAIDYSFHMNITHWDEGVRGQIPDLLDLGIPSLKVFTAYNDRLRLDDGEIFQVMRSAKDHGMLPMLHAENGDVIELLVREALAAGHTSPLWHARTRPAWGAVESVLRGISLAAMAECPVYIVHMNTAGGLDQLRYGREHGLAVMGETCPQYLFFDIEQLGRPDGAKWICSPPMRTQADNQALWEGLGDGSLQVVGTDHCPFFFDGTTPIEYEGESVAIPGKELGAGDFTKIPNGVPAVGDRLPVLWTYGVGSGRITPNQFVALTSSNAARIFGLYPQKGSLRVGADADLVVWDEDRELTYGVKYAHHRTDYNLWEGYALKGFPERVFLRGELIVDGARWLGQPGRGQFLPREPVGELI